MRKVALIGVVCCLIQTLWAQRQPAMYSKADQQKMNHWVDSVYNRLSPTERVGQLFMVLANPKSDARNLQLVNRYVNELKIGGVLFHKGSPQEQALVTNKMQDASRVPLLVSLDGEWGLSMRLSNTTRFPKNMMLGAIQNDSLIYAYGQEVARQCRELGIHINFAPDIDVNSNPENPVIGLRAFGEDPKLVTRKGLAYARGMEDAGVMSVAKHFPGHGDTSEDSHVTLPVVNKSISSIENI
ncbi:MAG: glycoside hydrolase family 3 N-terminal domain-containing protein, partial [Tannerellaceae bacterium]